MNACEHIHPVHHLNEGSHPRQRRHPKRVSLSPVQHVIFAGLNHLRTHPRDELDPPQAKSIVDVHRQGLSHRVPIRCCFDRAIRTLKKAPHHGPRFFVVVPVHPVLMDPRPEFEGVLDLPLTRSHLDPTLHSTVVERPMIRSSQPVSYTHLTLPTICSV